MRRAAPEADASARWLCGPRLTFDVKLEDAAARPFCEICRAALLEDRERLDTFVARPGDVAVRRKETRRRGADLRARHRQPEAERVLETFGPARVRDGQVVIRACDLDERRGYPGAAPAALVFDRGGVRGRGVLRGVIERALVERQARQLRGDARRKMRFRRRSLGDGARFGERRRGGGKVAALDREGAEHDQR